VIREALIALLVAAAALVAGVWLWLERETPHELLGVRNSVFKITVTSEEPDYRQPWKKNNAGTSTGSGFYIGERRIMTNAHVIASGRFITVQRDGDVTPIPAEVKFVGHDCDLAILEVEDEKLLKGIRPLPFGEVPSLQSPVSTLGYPRGGEQISITEGVVSRISFRPYVHPGGESSHFLIQVDSAINAGNSGGPVMQGDSVVGVAFQAYTTAENTGYIIPVPVIKRFLADTADGVYDGHPRDGLATMLWASSNPAAAKFYGLAANQTGAVVSHVAHWSAMQNQLQTGDIILAIDGYSVGADDKVTFYGERVDFRTIFDLKLHGDQVRWLVLRAGKQLEIQHEVIKPALHYQSGFSYAFRPRYLVYGGLVFTALTSNYFATFGSRWYRDAPFLLRYLDIYADYEKDLQANEEIIVVTDRLPHPVNAFAGAAVQGVLTMIDGKRIVNLEQLARSLEESSEEFVRLSFWGEDSPVVLSRANIKEQNIEINSRYGVRPDRWYQRSDATANPASEISAPGH
jgi:S1-C subfamily serine protease